MGDWTAGYSGCMPSHVQVKDFVPAPGRILVRVDKKDIEKKGSLYVPKTSSMAMEVPAAGYVIALGQWDENVFGKKWIRVGDYVAYPYYSGVEYTFKCEGERGNKYMIIQPGDLTGWVPKQSQKD